MAFEFINQKQWAFCINSNDPRAILNQLLRDNSKTGFAQIGEGHHNFVCSTVSREVGMLDTHEAVVFLRPIEEEKAECEHELKREMITNDTSGRNLLLTFDNDFCPKCGEKLN